MDYGEAKVYFDGSHYIAIPKVEQPWKKRKKTIKANQVLNESKVNDKTTNEKVATAKVDLKVLFETLYKENIDKKHKERNEKIIECLDKYIKNKEKLNETIRNCLVLIKRIFLIIKI